MLETIQIKTSATPKCILEAVAPERASISKVAKAQLTLGIDQYIADLPKNKRWVLRLVNSISRCYKVDEKLVMSIISVESDVRGRGYVKQRDTRFDAGDTRYRLAF